MSRLVRLAAAVLAASGLSTAVYAAEVATAPNAVIRDMSDMDVAVGVGTPGGNIGTAPGFRLFTQPPTVGAKAQNGLTGGDKAALTREFSFLDEADESAFLDVVAAIRNDPDQPRNDDAGAAVNAWTDLLDDEKADPDLAPPAQRPRDRMEQPSSMGPQGLP